MLSPNASEYDPGKCDRDHKCTCYQGYERELKLIKKRDSLNHQVCCGDYFGPYLTINIDIFPNKHLTAPQKRLLTNEDDNDSSDRLCCTMHYVVHMLLRYLSFKDLQRSNNV